MTQREVSWPVVPAGQDRGRRILFSAAWLVVVVWSAVTVVFLLSRVAPADPARLVAGLDAGPEQVATVRAQLGLDDPLVVQYGRYVSGLVRGDLGTSFQTRRPVLDDLLSALPATLELVVTAFLVYAAIGILGGVVWAYWPRGLHAPLLRLVTVVGVALPVFWIALMLQIVFASRLGWFPVAGNLSYRTLGVERVTGAGIVDAFIALDPAAIAAAASALVLPVAAMVVNYVAVAMALTRSSMQVQLRRDYVRTARARGVPERRIVLVDVLRNALNPVVTMLGLQFGWMLGGAVIIEVIFSWPGVGLYAFNAFQSFDYNAIMGFTIVTTVTFVLVNTLVGHVYTLLDPRIKERS